jgi:hypothetical protein
MSRFGFGMITPPSGAEFVPIEFVRKSNIASNAGLSLSLDIGSAGTDRLITCHAYREATTLSASVVTVDGKTMTNYATVKNQQAFTNIQRIWYIGEAALGASNGTVTVAWDAGSTAEGLGVMLFTGVEDTAPFDYGFNNTALNVVTDNVTGIDVPVNGIAIMSATGGGSGTHTWSTGLIERWDFGITSAVAGAATKVEESGQTNATYTVNWSASQGRSAVLVASWGNASTA